MTTTPTTTPTSTLTSTPTTAPTSTLTSTPTTAQVLALQTATETEVPEDHIAENGHLDIGHYVSAAWRAVLDARRSTAMPADVGARADAEIAAHPRVAGAATGLALRRPS